MVRLFISILTCILAVTPPCVLAGENEKPKKSSSSPAPRATGPGIMSTSLGCGVIKHCLDLSPNAPAVTTEVHLHGWPTDESTLDDADTIVLFCDGSDHDVKAPSDLARRPAQDARQADESRLRAGGDSLHGVRAERLAAGPSFSNGSAASSTIRPAIRRTIGIPKFKTLTRKRSRHRRTTPFRGLTPFQLSEEYYYNIRFRDGDQTPRADSKHADPG